MSWRPRLGTRGGRLGFGSWLPTAGAARVHGNERDVLTQEEKGTGNRRGVLLTTLGCCDDGWRPRIEGAGVKSWRRRGSGDGGAVLGSSGSTVALGHMGELGEAVAAEGKRERAAG
jgi:hypothetical protein